MPSHHLSDETLLDYSAGALSVFMETLVACHLTVCPTCRYKAAQIENIGGELMSQLAITPMKASVEDTLNALDKPTMQSIAKGQDSSVLKNTQTGGLSRSPLAKKAASQMNRPHEDLTAKHRVQGVPRPLARLLPSSIDELPWRTLGPGLKQFNLSDQPRKAGAFKLVKAEPGATFSQHTHEHRELTFVVSGSYTDELGTFKTGDIADLDGQHMHCPVIDSDKPCISLIATDAPVRFSGVFSKMLQPFVRI